MKRNKYILPIVGLALMLNSCYDDKMVWGTPDGHNPVVSADIPLALAEKIANYDYIKKYVPQEMTLGIGAGADLYIF
jgi:hypothetical protein